MALLYTAGSLYFFDVLMERATDEPSHPGFTLPADPARQLRATVRPEAPQQAVFAVPFETVEMEQTGQYRFLLLPGADLPRCTVQVIAEGDHHLSFTHLYRLAHLPRTGFSFTVPLLGDELYWKTAGHTGSWSAWERSGLRRLEVKVFSSAPLGRAELDLRYRADRAPATPLRLAWSRGPAESLALGDRVEWAFDLAGWNGNPFDYKALPVTLEVTDPDGKTNGILPFLYQEFEARSHVEAERIRPSGPKHFRARYRPVGVGPHRYRLLMREGGGSTRVVGDGVFQVAGGAAPGFLRVSKRAPHYFERADGRFVYLLGWNLPYPVDRPYGSDYVSYLPPESSLAITRKMLDDIADSGGNFIRFWLSDWWNGLEWNKEVDQYSGMGRYNLKNAWLNDQVVAHCERRGLYMQWETLNHVRLSDAYGWPQHPYNAANGGFLAGATEFWANPETRKWSENRLSYIVARYADSPAIQSWNLMSEPDLVSRFVWPAARQLIVSQMEFVHRLDPYGHITSSHLCRADHDPGFFLEDRLEFVNCNAYPGLYGLGGDQIQAIRDYATRFGNYGRPMMVSECAGHWGGDPAFKMRRDTLGSLWAGVASNLAGSPMSWWWNFNYGEDLGRLYRVVADFMKGEDLIAADISEGGRWVNRLVQASSQAGNMRALMAGNRSRRFLFVYNFDTLSRTRAIPSVCADNGVTFSELNPGEYHAEYWDLRTGQTPLRQEVTVGADGVGVLHPPDFTEGWAVKIGPRSVMPLPAPVKPPAAALAPSGAGVVSGSPADWAWRIQPLAEVVYPAARARSWVEVRLALPAVCRGRYPRLVNEAGAPVPFAWQGLGDGSGWQLRIPATSVSGALRVTAVEEPPGQTFAFREELFGLGLTVAAGRTGWLATRPDFTKEFLRIADRKQTRVGSVDQLENPLGENENFLALYQGPLLIPADGVYVFASNSDDASFVSVDGREVVAWPGQHEMEEKNRPTFNRWERRGRVELKKGMHWVEYDHQQGGGACLARLGWQMPAAAGGKNGWPVQPYGDGVSPAPEVVPEWALDGRIPCRIEVQVKGRTAVTLLDPCLGLELRRPATRLFTVALAGTGGREFRSFSTEGWQTVDFGGQGVPVWAWNAQWRRFSLEWEACVDATRRPALKVMLYDVDMPLRVQFGREPAVAKPVSRRVWAVWPRPSPERTEAFVISRGSVPLVRGVLAGKPDGQPDIPGGAP